MNDHYDSEGVLGTAGGLNVAFKNLINMLYSRDLSKKIRSAQMARARKGEYLGGFARYGYEKSPEDKHRLVVDPEAAEVMLGNSGRKDVESEREALGEKLDSLRKEKERLSAEKMFLYDKYRSGGYDTGAV